MVAHIMDMLKQDNNIESVCLRTAGSDVIAILVAFMAEFKAVYMPKLGALGKLWKLELGGTRDGFS